MTNSAQGQYFQYLATSLWMLNLVSTESASAITDGLDVIDIVEKLYPDFVKKWPNTTKPQVKNLTLKKRRTVVAISQQS